MRKIISPKDFEQIKSFYDEAPHEGLPLSAEEFVDNIGWRFYTEACLDRAPQPHTLGETGKRAFEQFIAEETHYALERGDLGVSQYRQARTLVLGGLVRASIAFFRSCEAPKHLWPKEGDKRNLRQSLKPWIQEGGLRRGIVDKVLDGIADSCR